ncbi:MAG: diacylglycerol/lipid kinase family protein [Solirubrobacteraceae bacterium]|jgi:YegS/Rv2252/BmrU family lipid kinase
MLSLIVNPSAGGGRAGRVLPEVELALASHGLDFHVERTRSIEHARELALAAHQSAETAVAFGGDGLVRALASVLKNTSGVLGVLPGGRGNDFARVLGIPPQPAAACAVLARGTVRALDLGQAGSESFVSIASCGYDSTANRIANETRLFHGNFVYTYAGLRALLSWRPARFELTLDGERRTLIAITVAVANSSTYGGGMRLAPDARLDDGLLDVVLIADASRFEFLRSLPKVFKGTHVLLPNVEVVRAREIEVRADRPFTMYADGDPIADLPVRLSCLPGAINVIVPQ